MKQISAWWLLPALIIGIAGAYLYLEYAYTPNQTVTIKPRTNYDVITLALPNSKDTAIFGPKYWKALHTITAKIPCSICRDKAVPFMNFFHDVVNHHTDKPIFDKENYNTHIDNISKLPKA